MVNRCEALFISTVQSVSFNIHRKIRADIGLALLRPGEALDLVLTTYQPSPQEQQNESKRIWFSGITDKVSWKPFQEQEITPQILCHCYWP